ncbi:MAG TPA: Mbeg1-like protein, partial [Clostridia bacterium]
MDDLNQTQLLLLDNLIYLEGVADQNDKTVSQVIDDLTKNKYSGLMRSQNPQKIGTDDEWPCCMTKQQWIDVIDAIKNDPKLCSLRISEGKTEEKTNKDKDGTIHDLGGMRAACFTDETSDKTTLVFRGTHGAYEWHDNGLGGSETITGQQQAALDYINNLPETYKNLIVTGHSKGGNKAQFVTIMSDRVEKCYSFDGQGFSKEFLEVYKEKIKEKSSKITSISAENDFVNCLLNSVAPNKYYVDT